MAASVKQFFFDATAVLRKVDKQTRTVLSKFGAFTRRSAKGLIRNGKKASRPGNPPHNHQGLLKKLIFFSYDPAQKCVTIGPEKLNQKIGDAPHALEYGGMSRVTSGGRRNKRVIRTVKIRARPYMGPAFKKEMKALPGLWASSVK